MEEAFFIADGSGNRARKMERAPAFRDAQTNSPEGMEPLRAICASWKSIAWKSAA